MNPFKRMKLKSKLRNCDYRLAGTVIKQQYYNDNSNTEINRMIDHFMEEPGFDRALDLIEYNEMIVFYFTESCTDGLYVRKTSNSTESIGGSEPFEEEPFEEILDKRAPLFAETPATLGNESITKTTASDHIAKPSSSYSENLQKIQESEEWMDEMISRLSKKPKLPTVAETPPPMSIPPNKIVTIAIPTAKVYEEDEAQSFDTIEFKSAEALRDIEVFEDKVGSPEIEARKEIYVFEEPEVFAERVVVQEPVVFVEPEVFTEPAVVQEPVIFVEPEVIAEVKQVEQVEKPNDAFDFVSSAQSSKHLETMDPAHLFTTSSIPDPTPLPARARVKRQRFPNVAATLKIDLHTMMKQLDEYRYELAYHPANEQQMISWIESLEKAIDEFSSAIDIIEDSYE